MVHQTQMAIQFTAVVDFVEKHRRGVLLSAGGLVVLGLGWGLWSSSQSEKAVQARDQLHQAVAANDEGGLEKVASSFAGTRSAFDAQMELGKRAAERKDWPRATSFYEKALRHPPSKLDASLAALGLASCLHAAGKLDEAAKHLTATVSKSDAAVLPEFLWALGSVKRELKDPEGARQFFNRLVAEFGDTEYAQKAREALGATP